MRKLVLALCLAPSLALAQDLPPMPDLPGVSATTETDGETTVGQTVSVEGQPFVINGMNQTLSHACGSNGSPDVIVNGMGSTITLTGDCGEVIINGTTMKVVISTVKKLTVGGMTNVVTYVSGPGGAKPEVTDAGMGNAIKQGKP